MRRSSVPTNLPAHSARARESSDQSRVASTNGFSTLVSRRHGNRSLVALGYRGLFGAQLHRARNTPAARITPVLGSHPVGIPLSSVWDDDLMVTCHAWSAGDGLCGKHRRHVVGNHFDHLRTVGRAIRHPRTVADRTSQRPPRDRRWSGNHTGHVCRLDGQATAGFGELTWTFRRSTCTRLSRECVSCY